jgi:hypothetical protein
MLWSKDPIQDTDDNDVSISGDKNNRMRNMCFPTSQITIYQGNMWPKVLPHVKQNTYIINIWLTRA